MFAALVRPLSAALALFAVANLAADERLDRIQAFSRKYCLECHNAKKPRGDLNLGRAASAAEITTDFRRWEKVVELTRSGAMPPEDAEHLPPLEERNSVITAIEAILLEEAKKHAGDPGVILPRRLSNTEFDRSVRDLTGIDIRPTQDFPADPAAGEGFDNTGEALTISPSLLKKYLGAAEHVADHLVLMTDGVEFAPFPVTSYNERKKFTEGAVIDFYRKHDVKLLDYLDAAWRYRYRAAADRETSIETWAKARELSPKYLARVWGTLEHASSGATYMKQLADAWHKLPDPTAGSKPPELFALEKLIAFQRRVLGAKDRQLIKSDAGNWPIAHLDLRAKAAAERDRFDATAFSSRTLLKFDRIAAVKNDDKPVTFYLRIDSAFGAENVVRLKRSLFSKAGQLPRNEDEATKQETVTLREILAKYAPDAAEKFAFEGESCIVRAPALLEIPLNAEARQALENKQLLIECELDAEKSAEGAVYVRVGKDKAPDDPFAAAELLVHPQSKLAAEIAADGEKFCDTFPNRFCFVDGERGLAAGFHLVEGFFRDDRPLVDKVLDDEQQRRLDRLWDELNFVTQSAETLLRGFVWFERAERHVLHDPKFDFLRAEDPLLVEEELLGRFERVYLEKNGVKLLPDLMAPAQPNRQFDLIHGFFEQVRSDLAAHRARLKVAEEAGLREVLQLAAKAYCRPLTTGEEDALRALYRKTRGQGQSEEDALRSVFAAVLMSPDFCFRLTTPPDGSGLAPLTDLELAKRLSYFLWSSLPDEPLLRAAREGRLRDDAELVAQTRRMCRDPKIQTFAREFCGQWLRYRDFLAKDAVPSADFPGYSAAVREALFEEPSRLMTFLVQDDRPVTEMLTSDVTFVNAALAKHYGGGIAENYARATGDEWRRVDGLRAQGRGGLFGMGVILAKNSAGARTSPIKRGFWTVHHLLGQYFPPPPAEVAELPPGEKEAKKTIRELIVEHTANPRCAMCHVHFDQFGMALEGFDSVGRARKKDLGGRAIDDLAVLPGGHEARGVPGLIDYVAARRKQDFVRTLNRKLLGYALGRSVTLSDHTLLSEMEAALATHGDKFSALFETVVKSPQFRMQRARDFADAAR